MVAYAKGELGEQAVPARRREAHHRHRLRPHDGAPCSEARHGVLAPLPQPAARRHRQHQLADAVHDEGGLRAVPAEARRPGDRQGDDRLLLLQPGSGARHGRLRATCRAPARQHGAGEARPTCGSTRSSSTRRTCAKFSGCPWRRNSRVVSFSRDMAEIQACRRRCAGGGARRDAEPGAVHRLLSCGIAFLLITAVWTTMAHVDVANTAAARRSRRRRRCRLTLELERDGWTLRAPDGSRVPTTRASLPSLLRVRVVSLGGDD